MSLAMSQLFFAQTGERSPLMLSTVIPVCTSVLKPGVDCWKNGGPRFWSLSWPLEDSSMGIFSFSSSFTLTWFGKVWNFEKQIFTNHFSGPGHSQPALDDAFHRANLRNRILGVLSREVVAHGYVVHGSWLSLSRCRGSQRREIARFWRIFWVPPADCAL